MFPLGEGKKQIKKHTKTLLSFVPDAYSQIAPSNFELTMYCPFKLCSAIKFNKALAHDEAWKLRLYFLSLGLRH